MRLERVAGKRAKINRLILLFAGLIIAAVMIPITNPLQADGIAVAANEVAIVDNDLCSLKEAIQNANLDSAVYDDCDPGSGPDTLILPAGSIYNLVSVDVGYGGDNGLPLIFSDITIDGNGSTITRNSATNFRLLAVAGSGTLTLNELTLSNGLMVTNVGGGAIFNDGGTLTINDSTLSGNENTAGEGGGAIRTRGGTVNINRSTLTNNQSSSNGGGAIYLTNSNSGNPATVTINQSLLAGNSALNTQGGAIAQSGGTLTLNNSTISGNQSQGSGGGGIYTASNGTLNLNNVTVTGNSSNNAGGGLLNIGSTVNINRSIISGNTAPSWTGSELVQYSGNTYANNYNVFGHDGLTNITAFANTFTPGANDINATALPNNPTPFALGSILNTTLANNGGPTMTHALVTGSPAIDFAPSAACTAAPINSVDQRGATRNVDGKPDASAGECDSGAYEYLGNIGPTNTPTPTQAPPTSTSTYTPTPTPITPTSTSTYTPTPTPITPTSTSTYTPTPTPITPTSTSTYTPTPTRVPPTETPTDTPTPTRVPPTETPTDTPTPTRVPPTETPTDTPTPTRVPPTDTPTSTPTNTPIANVCPANTGANELTTIIGKGMGSDTKASNVVKIVIPNSDDVIELYGQLAGKDQKKWKYARFLRPNGTYINDKTLESPAYRKAAIFWYGQDLTPTTLPHWRARLIGAPTGKPFVQRAFILYPTYQTSEAYFNVVRQFDDSSQNFAHWDTANGWTATQTQIIPIAPPALARALTVTVAVVDNDLDTRPFELTISAGGASQTVTANGPTNGNLLNLVQVTLQVPPGTSSIELELVSPPINGDSVAMVGMAANYACNP